MQWWVGRYNFDTSRKSKPEDKNYGLRLVPRLEWPEMISVWDDCDPYKWEGFFDAIASDSGGLMSCSSSGQGILQNRKSSFLFQLGTARHLPGVKAGFSSVYIGGTIHRPRQLLRHTTSKCASIFFLFLAIDPTVIHLNDVLISYW
jgi:hypothetical protein